jgi:hypothetical protein
MHETHHIPWYRLRAKFARHDRSDANNNNLTLFGRVKQGLERDVHCQMWISQDSSKQRTYSWLTFPSWLSSTIYTVSITVFATVVHVKKCNHERCHLLANQTGETIHLQRQFNHKAPTAPIAPHSTYNTTMHDHTPPHTTTHQHTPPYTTLHHPTPPYTTLSHYTPHIINLLLRLAVWLHS